MTKEALEIWTVYERPKDFPGKFVCRLFRIYPGHTSRDGPTDIGFVEDTLEAVRERMRGRGLTMLPRDPSDDPVIVECWI